MKINAINQKKKLKTFDFDVMMRLIITMYESGKEKKTNIARNSKMGYDKCIPYLNCLEFLDFIKKSVDEDGYELYDLTSQGLDFYKRKLSDIFENSNSRDSFPSLSV